MAVTHLHDTEIWFQCGKCVVCNLRFCSRNNRQKSTLACIRETYQTHICQDLQFENKSTFCALLARLRVAWSLICSGAEVPVTQTSTTTFQKNELLTMFGDLSYNFGASFACLLIGENLLRYRAERYGDNNILCIFTVRASARATFAIFGKLVTLIFEVNECPILLVALQDYRATLTAIATIGTTKGDKLLTAKVSRACSSVSGTGKYLYIVYEI